VKEAAASTRQMGQELFNPPNVGGWTSGVGWISTSSLLERFNFANRLITARQGNGAAPLVFDPGKLLNGKGLTTAEQLVDYFTSLLLDGDLSADQRNALIGYLQLNDAGQQTTFTLDAKTLDSKVRGLIHLVTAAPAYQLN
jgi:hypothetical protein